MKSEFQLKAEIKKLAKEYQAARGIKSGEIKVRLDAAQQELIKLQKAK